MKNQKENISSLLTGFVLVFFFILVLHSGSANNNSQNEPQKKNSVIEQVQDINLSAIPASTISYPDFNTVTSSSEFKISITAYGSDAILNNTFQLVFKINEKRYLNIKPQISHILSVYYPYSLAGGEIPLIS